MLDKINSLDISLAVLLICVLNMNILDTVGIMNQLNTQFIRYILFILYILLIIIYILKSKKKIILSRFWVYSILLLLTYDFASEIINNYNANIAKFILCILLAYLTIYIPIQSIKIFVFNTLLLNVVYAVFLLYNLDFAISLRGVEEGTNYLNITLPLGLASSFLIYYILINKKIWAIILSIFFFFTLSRFDARGNILFPIILLAVCFLFNTSGRIKKIMLVGSMVLVIFFGFNNDFSGENIHLIQRFTRLFENTEQEPRVYLYISYINYIFDNATWIIGSGFGSSQSILNSLGLDLRYPHNFILELICESGLIGMFVALMFTFKLLNLTNKSICKINKLSNSEDKVLLGACLSGFLFYMMNWSKSYSIYDAYPMFIMFSVTSTTYKHHNMELKNAN